jgi:hypothetical protein
LAFYNILDSVSDETASASSSSPGSPPLLSQGGGNDSGKNQVNTSDNNKVDEKTLQEVIHWHNRGQIHFHA